ncbi:MAG: YheV family putative metal-binding protein [Pseudomonadota bacterium]|nr:YheV family putative metal-binding protein [Pseudomonadota bacterium]
MPEKRQFIAGAACPKCRQRDCLVQVQSFADELSSAPASVHFECVDCAHRFTPDDLEQDEPDEKSSPDNSAGQPVQWR